MISPIDYAHEKNSRALLKEFSLRHPVETYTFLKELNTNAKKHRYLNISLTIDNPPDYGDVILTKRQAKHFKKLKLHIHYRRLIIRFMEFYIAGRSPKFVYEFN